MRRYMVFFSVFFVLLLIAPVAAQQAGSAGEESSTPSLSVEQMTNGTCRSPREAMLQLLYWSQFDEKRVDLQRAAACFDASVPAQIAQERAEQLKKTLDVRGVFVEIDNVPDNSEYLSETGGHRWRLPGFAAVEIVKRGSRWVFSAATIKAIPSLYEEAIPPFVERIIDELPDWANGRLFGVSVWQVAAILLFVILAVVLQRVVVFAVGTYLRRALGRLEITWVDKAMDHVARPIGGLATAVVFYVVTPWLQLSVRVSQVARAATTAIAVFSVAWLAYRMVDVLSEWLLVKAKATESKLDDQLVPLLRRSLKLFIAVIGVIFVLQNLNVDVGSLLAGLGLGGLAFALAAKDTLANFFGSLVVFIDKPFQIGDWVVIDSVEGIVQDVRFRTTRVRTFYDSVVTIPNAKLTDTAIDNYGARKYRRYVANLGLTYDTPPERMAAFCEGVRGIIQRIDGMRRDYSIVEFNTYGDSGLGVMVYCFMDAPSWGEELAIRTHLNLEILRLAKDLGVSFAFPTRTLHIDTQATPTVLPGRLELDPAQIAAVVERYGTSSRPPSG